MEAVQVVIIGIVSTILIVMLKKSNAEFSIYIGIAASIVILFIIIDKLSVILDLISRITGLININDIYIKILLQILGIAFITEFGAQLCKDAGQQAIASKIEMVGKIMILIISMPVILSIINMITNILV
ncbi:stage III sporulation protein AD [Vallitalea longa]|uniref:Stage III sporulation protein AD n=1 Tax=Vallitalea longa TaxID=2936439 RepID=A0A9W6DG45_9FIRM|nr:stage III sporulation protein AD [Vallitalea longa]GKX31921.1 stage III sporulation protein AD [Vallitalea longa]